MFHDRDIFVLGAGAVLATLALLLPFSFAWKVGAAAVVLILALLMAFARFGFDRLPLEAWVWRRLRFHLRPRRWTFYSGRPVPTASNRPPPELADEPSRRPELPDPASPLLVRPADTAIYPLLVICGTAFVLWLAQGGAVSISTHFRVLLP